MTPELDPAGGAAPHLRVPLAELTDDVAVTALKYLLRRLHLLQTDWALQQVPHSGLVWRGRVGVSLGCLSSVNFLTLSAALSRHVGAGNLPADGVVELLQVIQLDLQLSDGRLCNLQILQVSLVLFLNLNLVGLVNITKFVPMVLILLRNLLVLQLNLPCYLLPLVSDLFFKIVFGQKITEFFQHVTNVGALVVGLFIVLILLPLLLPRVDDVPHLCVFLRSFRHE